MRLTNKHRISMNGAQPSTIRSAPRTLSALGLLGGLSGQCRTLASTRPTSRRPAASAALRQSGHTRHR